MFNNLLHLLRINKERMTILVVGLNSSGKSSIINQWKRRNTGGNESKNGAIVVPTVGFNIEEFYSKNTKLYPSNDFQIITLNLFLDRV